MDDKTKTISISIPEGLYNKIKEMAIKDRRSVSSMICKLVEERIGIGEKK